MIIYSELVTELAEDDFNKLYTSSESPLINGNFPVPTLTDSDGHIFTTLGTSFEHTIRGHINGSFIKGSTAFVLREEGTGLILSFQQGTLDDDGTFHSRFLLFSPDSAGSLGWVYNQAQFGGNSEVVKHLGIKRMCSYPIGENMIAFVRAIGKVQLEDLKNGSKAFRTPWGWDNYETNLVDM